MTVCPVGTIVFQVLCRADLASCPMGFVSSQAYSALAASIFHGPLSGWSFDLSVSYVPPWLLTLSISASRSIATSRVWELSFPLNSLTPEMAVVSEVMSS